MASAPPQHIKVPYENVIPRKVDSRERLWEDSELSSLPVIALHDEARRSAQSAKACEKKVK